MPHVVAPYGFRLAIGHHQWLCPFGSRPLKLLHTSHPSVFSSAFFAHHQNTGNVFRRRFLLRSVTTASRRSRFACLIHALLLLISGCLVNVSLGLHAWGGTPWQNNNNNTHPCHQKIITQKETYYLQRQSSPYKTMSVCPSLPPLFPCLYVLFILLFSCLPAQKDVIRA